MMPWITTAPAASPPAQRCKCVCLYIIDLSIVVYIIDLYVCLYVLRRRRVLSPAETKVLSKMENKYTLKIKTSGNGLAEDGYKWRKYGQKSIKNSPNPRYILLLFKVGSDSDPIIIISSELPTIPNEGQAVV